MFLNKYINIHFKLQWDSFLLLCVYGNFYVGLDFSVSLVHLVRESGDMSKLVVRLAKSLV